MPISKTDFEDNRQPETAIRLPNPEVLNLRKLDIYHQNSNGKSGVYDHRELEESACTKLLEQRLVTRSSDIPEILYMSVWTASKFRP